MSGKSTLVSGMGVGTGRKAKNVFRVTVDYDRNLQEMIKSGAYNRVNRDIIQEHFPIIGQGKQKVEVTLFHFNRVISSKEVIREMDKAR